MLFKRTFLGIYHSSQNLDTDFIWEPYISWRTVADFIWLLDRLADHDILSLGYRVVNANKEAALKAGSRGYE